MKIAIDMTGTNFMSGTKTYNLNFCEHLIKKEMKQKIFIFICKNYKEYLLNSNNKNIKHHLSFAIIYLKMQKLQIY